MTTRRTRSNANNYDSEASAENRYQRQAQLLAGEGWNQLKLTNARVAVIGNGSLANYCALTLAAFGFGNIDIYCQGKFNPSNFSRDNSNGELPDYSEGFLYYDANSGDSKAIALEDIIHKINPEVKITATNIGMNRPENYNLMEKPHIVVDATNDPASKLSAIDYSLLNSIPIVSMSAGKHKGGVGLLTSRTPDKRKIIENIVFNDLKNQKQDPVISQLIAGIGIEEVRKIINPMRRENVIDDIIIYNLLSNARFNHDYDRDISDDFDLSDYSICLVGAGALGNQVAIALAQRNIGKLVVVDYDITENTNLNRQIMLYDSVDQEKATGLVDKLRKINPRGNYRAKIDKITPSSADFFRRNDFDLILDTVDNNKTRALLNYFSLRYNIPFISGGTRYNSGQVNVCKPEDSGCLNCQADIDNLALGNYQRQSCIYAAQPSVITSNQITGAMMVGEIPFVLNKEKYGDFARGELKFVSNEEFRFSLIPPAVENCECNHDTEMLNSWHNKMRGVYD